MRTDSMLKFFSHSDDCCAGTAVLMLTVSKVKQEMDSSGRVAWADQLRKRFLSHAISIFKKLEFPPVYAAPPFTHFYYHCCRNCLKPV
jgi:hypothetical protein